MPDVIVVTLERTASVPAAPRPEPLTTAAREPVWRTEMAGPHTREFTDDNFEAEVLHADEPVLVDFWAPWCAPCKALGPVIDELAGEYNGKVKVGKLDTDKNMSTAVKYAVSSIPTVILFQAGEVKDRFVGYRDKEDFETAIDKVLATA